MEQQLVRGCGERWWCTALFGGGGGGLFLTASASPPSCAAAIGASATSTSAIAATKPSTAHARVDDTIVGEVGSRVDRVHYYTIPNQSCQQDTHKIFGGLVDVMCVRRRLSFCILNLGKFTCLMLENG